MTDAPETDIPDDEEALLLTALLRERDLTGLATVTQIAIARQAARLLADPNGGERTATSVASLLALLPPPSRRIEQPAAGEWDMSRLSDFQVLLMEELTEVGTGVRPASSFGDRMTHALELVRALDRAGTMEQVEQLPEEARTEMRSKIATLTNLLFAPFRPADIVHNPFPAPAELDGLKARVSELEAMLAARPARLPPPMTPAERAVIAEAEAPIVSRSNVDVLSDMVAGRPSDTYDYLGV